MQVHFSDVREVMFALLTTGLIVRHPSQRPQGAVHLSLLSTYLIPIFVP